MTLLRILNADLQRAATEQLGEISVRMTADLKSLKIWINQQPHLKANTDDQFLIAFLRGCKYNLEKAKTKLDKFYTYKTKFPEMFKLTDIDDCKLRDLLKMGIFTCLPTPFNETGARICIFRCGAYPANQYTFQKVMHLTNVIREILMLEDDYVTVNGLICIIDFQNTTMSHIFQMTPGLMRKNVVFTEKASPLRLKAVHYVNTVAGFEIVYNLVKPMLSQKLRNRLHVHGHNMNSLAKDIPLKYLPKEYGGENGSIESISNKWNIKLEKYRDYFAKSAAYGVDEKLRAGYDFKF